MMEQIEKLVYGYVNKGGLVERLGRAETDLFGRSLPGTIAERHTAIVNFLEIGTEEQPSMVFKLGVAEWIINKKIDASKSVMSRLENLETLLNGASNQGQPVAMRIESLLTVLVSDPVTFKNVRLPANTIMRFRFLDELSPATSKVGDVVRLELTNDLIVNKCLVAPAGSLLVAEVRAVKRPRSFGIPGEVRLTFNALVPLGPQKPTIAIGKEAEAALKEARKLGDKGEGAMVGAGAVSLAGAALLGPVGLVSGFFIRGNSIKISVGSVTFAQISPDIVVSAYPIPVSLQNDLPEAYVTEEIETPDENSYDDEEQYTAPARNNRDTIIQGDVFNRNQFDYNKPASKSTQTRTQSRSSIKRKTTGTQSYNSANSEAAGDDFELPEEEAVR